VALMQCKMRISFDLLPEEHALLWAHRENPASDFHAEQSAESAADASRRSALKQGGQIFQIVEALPEFGQPSRNG